LDTTITAQPPTGKLSATDRLIFGIILGIVVAFVLFVVYLAAATIAQMYYDADGTPTTTFYQADYMRAMGLNVNKPIPLRLGNLVNGTSGTTTSTVSGGLFGFSSVTSLDFGPDQLLKIGFQRSDGTRYIFYFSIKKVRVSYPALHAGQHPYIKFTINNSAVTTQYDSWTQVRAKNAWAFQAGEYRYFRPPLSHQTAAWSEIQSTGLAKYLERSVTSIVLGLTPSQYQRILNG